MEGKIGVVASQVDSVATPLAASVRDAVRAVQPGKRAARRAWRKEQYEVLLARLGEGKRERALADLHSLRPTTGEVPPPLEEAIRYLETQQDWMGNYQ